MKKAIEEALSVLTMVASDEDIEIELRQKAVLSVEKLLTGAA